MNRAFDSLVIASCVALLYVRNIVELLPKRIFFTQSRKEEILSRKDFYFLLKKISAFAFLTPLRDVFKSSILNPNVQECDATKASSMLQKLGSKS